MQRNPKLQDIVTSISAVQSLLKQYLDPHFQW